MGILVLDLSNVRTSAQASQLLADFGADVVLVKSRGGSPLRTQAAWPFWARGKRTVQLNLHVPEDAVIVRNPWLIYASISGFGRDKPRSELQDYDGIVAAKFGVHWMQGMADRAGPCFCTVAYPSFAASQFALQGVLAALYDREDSGLGQRIEASLVKALTIYDPYCFFSRVAAIKYRSGLKQRARNRRVPTGGLSFRLLIAPTRDGRWLQFSQTSDRLFRAMLRMFDLEWMFDEPRVRLLRRDRRPLLRRLDADSWMIARAIPG
jgi:crotonobetainyl-CoA:carnitine CoA-transferase CaiB-like acyl-CoA transferase